MDKESGSLYLIETLQLILERHMRFVCRNKLFTISECCIEDIQRKFGGVSISFPESAIPADKFKGYIKSSDTKAARLASFLLEKLKESISRSVEEDNDSADLILDVSREFLMCLGKGFYVPKGMHLNKKYLHEDIVIDSNSMSKFMLARKYDLSVRTVEHILKKSRQHE